MSNILFVVPRYHTNMIPMVDALQSFGHRVKVVTQYAGPCEDYSLLHPHVIGEQPISRYVVHDILKDFKPDKLIIRGYSENFIRFSKSARSAGIQTVFYDQEPFRISLRNLDRFVIQMIFAIRRIVCCLPLSRITPTPGGKDGTRFPKSRFFYYPMKTSEEARERLYTPNGYPRIICIGKLAAPRKRHDWVLKALEELDCDCKLTIAGASYNMKKHRHGSKEYYKNLLKRIHFSPIKERISLLQDHPWTALQSLYFENDIMILPSYRETFSISVLEAMAAGCVVIAADDGGSSNYIENGRDGVIFRNASYPHFRDCVCEMVSSADLIPTLGKNAAASIAKHSHYANFVGCILGNP